MTLSVTEQAIPFNDFSRFDYAMNRRAELAEDIRIASKNFYQADLEMEFLHKKSVEHTKASLDALTVFCNQYKKNLGWS